jgi:hypothetical protein
MKIHEYQAKAIFRRHGGIVRCDVPSARMQARVGRIC